MTPLSIRNLATHAAHHALPSRTSAHSTRHQDKRSHLFFGGTTPINFFGKQRHRYRMSGAGVHAFTTLDALAEANAQIGMARINANLAHSAATTAYLASLFEALPLIDRRSKHAAVRLAEQAHKRAEGTNPAAPPFEHNNLK